MADHCRGRGRFSAGCTPPGARSSAATSGGEPAADPVARLDFPFAAPLLNRTTRMAVGVARTHELRSAGTRNMKHLKLIAWSLAAVLLAAGPARASEASLAIPDLTKGH